MSNFHSTLSRRDFMKGLGLAGAGLGAAAAAAPVFHDLDEVIASPKSNWERPWWVKEREFGAVMQEMDWDTYQAFDYDTNGASAGLKLLLNDEERTALFQTNNNQIAQFMIENKPGYTLRDRAMRDALVRGDSQQGLSAGFGLPGERKSRTPEYRGNKADPKVTVPRWNGTPEENSRMMRSVLMFRGARMVAFAKLDEKSKKFIFKKRSGLLQVFEDVDQPYKTDTKLVTPNKCQYAITYMCPRCEETWRRGPSHISDAGEMIGYSYGRIVWAGGVEFLNAIGYMGLGSQSNGYKLNPPFAVWTGIGESARVHNSAISPEIGNSMATFVIITDLPVEPTPPIDAGIFRYCHTCSRCSDNCPSGALTGDQPTWDLQFGDTNMAGQKAFPFHFAKCLAYWYEDSSYCAICIRNCPFAHKTAGMVHDVVSAAISYTGAFDGFFNVMDKFWGYGEQADPESWWDLPPKMHGMWGMDV